jgi:hypothetical protein
MRKLKIIIACWSTVVTLGILISFFLFIFGMENRIEVFAFLYFAIGTPVIFILCWPFYSKRLK